MAVPNIPGSTLRTTLSGMQIGDYISCEYTAASNTVGIFKNLGQATKAEIFTAGTSTPDGTFYFVKTASGTLIADRVIQTYISWDKLNTSDLVEGKPLHAFHAFPFEADLYSYNKTKVLTGVTPTYAVGKFGTGFSSANGQYYYLVNAIEHQDTFTIGGWYNITPGSRTAYPYENVVCSVRAQGTDANHIGFGISTDGYFAILYTNSTSPYHYQQKSSVLVTNSFQHIALSKTGSTFTLYLNGTSILTFTYALPNTTHFDLYSTYYNSSANTYYKRVTSIDDDVFISQRCLSQTEIQSIYNNGLKAFAAVEANQNLRIPSGGNCFLDEQNHRSTLNRDLGAFPVHNEWDQYVVNSTLGGKITAGSQEVWNWRGMFEELLGRRSAATTSTDPFIVTLAAATTIKSLKVLRTTGGADQTISEVRIWSNGVNIANTATITNSGGIFYNGSNGQGLVDGNLTAYSWDDSTAANEYVLFTFTNAVTITGFEIYGGSGYPVYNLEVYALKFSDNHGSNLVSWVSNTQHSSLSSNANYRVVRGFGQAKQFNGSSDYITFANPVIPTGSKTIRFQIYVLTAPSSEQFVFTNGVPDATDKRFYCSIRSSSDSSQPGGLTFGSKNGNTFNVLVTTNINICDARWHEVLYVQNEMNRTVELYIDGVKRQKAVTGYTEGYQSNLTDTQSYSQNLLIGASYQTSSANRLYYFKGALDEIKMYNSNYDLVFYIANDSVTDTTSYVQDHSGNGYHGTGTGTSFIDRAKLNGLYYSLSSTTNTQYGFRPVLKYTE